MSELLKVKKVLDEFSIPFAFIQWNPKTPPDLPYILYSRGSIAGYGADDTNYMNSFYIFIDLYQNHEEYIISLETELKDLLRDNGYFYSISEPIYIESEKLMQTTFTINVIEMDE